MRMASSISQDETHPDDEVVKSASTFNPTNRTGSKPSIELPDELWITVLESPCTFPQDIFHEVMLNLIKNPNITSSHLFRADIFYDSEKDQPSKGNLLANGSLLKQLKRKYQPAKAELPGLDLQQTIVRQLVPRNPQLDRPLVQTCHVFTKSDDDQDHMVVLYVPHAHGPDEIPFYHPAVPKLAFEHRSYSSGTSSISISYSLFPESSLTTKLERTALKLLQTVHKHGQGQLAGYQKRVHHDQIVPQKRYQDTYTKLKAKYGRQLSEQWVEVTDPGKHVFEDLGIAAFLIELWRDMYAFPDKTNGDHDVHQDIEGTVSKPAFPGFVDVGCGNGVLVYVLLAEGYGGWGFDARERKTWNIFPLSVRERLQRRLLIPETFMIERASDEIWHNGLFKRGTFVISNHADELTGWTPLLAYLNASAFIAIPCCSHDLAGARFRAPPTSKIAKGEALRPPQKLDKKGSDLVKGAVETGSLKRTDMQKKMPSAYSTLCSYVTSLAAELDFEPEHELLRIPSTRNQCIVGGRRERKDQHELSEPQRDAREHRVIDIVERELGRCIGAVSADWIARAEKLAKKPGSGH